MASNQPAAKQSSRWGSFLSGAVAGLESRLDTILADENDASAKARAAEVAAKETKATTTSNGTATPPVPAEATALPPSASKAPPRPNDRLQERLAKAMVNRSGTGTSQAGSERSSPNLRPTSSLGLASPRTSLDSRPSIDLDNVTTPAIETAPAKPPVTHALSNAAPLPRAEVIINPPADELLASALPINPAQSIAIAEAGKREEIGAASIDSPKSSLDLLPTLPAAGELQADLIQFRAEREEEDRRKQEEMDMVLERVDALQAKLQYLARETVAAAKQANGSAANGSLEQKIAEKDEKIALLMEEGTNLSKTEMRHLANIRKLSAKVVTEEKTSSELRKNIERLKRSELELKSRVARLEQSSKEDAERITRLSAVESQMLAMTLELSSNEATAADLRNRLELAETRIESMESAATTQLSLVADTRRIGDLEEELANAAIEKKLAEDRAKLENKRLVQVMEQQKDKAQATELELKTEITALEARMEALRLRAEEVTSDRTEDSQAKLLRQMELLQTQYALAAENWRTIEGSLNARLTAVEKERDEGFRRENETRKKARELGLKCRKLEEELDSGTDKTSTLGNELSAQKALVGKLETRLKAVEKAAEDARADFENQRQTMEAEFATRLEEQRSRGASISMSTSQRSKHTGSPVSLLRKSSATENTMSHARRGPNRYQTNDSIASLSMFDRPISSRRPSGMPNDFSRGQSPVIDQVTSPTSMSSIGRKQSGFSFAHMNGGGFGSQPSIPPSIQADTPPTPSIAATTEAGTSPALGSIIATPTSNDRNDDEDTFSRHSATAADVISATTVHTGPSVALVERMSSSIRRLEAEKAAHRDEVARLMGQRDEARDQMVALLREAEAGRSKEKLAGETKTQLDALTGRYEACLEMLGEREEEVEELRGDLGEMKRIYKELASQMGRE